MIQKMKSILIFQKWTKINVQNWDAKNVLTDRNFYFSLQIFIVTTVIVKNIFVIVFFFVKT
jgi:hypothetical protein